MKVSLNVFLDVQNERANNSPTDEKTTCWKKIKNLQPHFCQEQGSRRQSNFFYFRYWTNLTRELSGSSMRSRFLHLKTVFVPVYECECPTFTSGKQHICRRKNTKVNLISSHKCIRPETFSSLKNQWLD